MSEQGDENLGLDWLDRLVEGYQREPMYEEPRWDQIMAELGRICVYFDMLDFIVKSLLLTLERQPQTGKYAQTAFRR